MSPNGSDSGGSLANSALSGASSLDRLAAAGLGLVSLLALIGNGLVLVAFAHNRRLREKCTNYFLVNLAVANLLVSLVSVPLRITFTLGYHVVTCKVRGVQNSQWKTVCISGESPRIRYTVARTSSLRGHPFKSPKTRRPPKYFLHSIPIERKLSLRAQFFSWDQSCVSSFCRITFWNITETHGRTRYYFFSHNLWAISSKTSLSKSEVSFADAGGETGRCFLFLWSGEHATRTRPAAL